MDNKIFLRVHPKDIHYLNRIMEGYEYLGVVSTVQREQGLVVVRVTPDTYNDVMNILKHLDISIQFSDL